MHENRTGGYGSENQDSFREVLTAQLAKLRDCLLDEHEQHIQKATDEVFLKLQGKRRKERQLERAAPQLSSLEVRKLSSLQSVASSRNRGMESSSEAASSMPLGSYFLSRNSISSKKALKQTESGGKLACAATVTKSMPLGSLIMPTKKAELRQGCESDSTFDTQSIKTILPTSLAELDGDGAQELPGWVDSPEENEVHGASPIHQSFDVPPPPLHPSPAPPERPPADLMSSDSSPTDAIRDTTDNYLELGFNPCDSQSSRKHIEERKSEPTSLKKRKLAKARRKSKTAKSHAGSAPASSCDSTRWHLEGSIETSVSTNNAMLPHSFTSQFSSYSSFLEDGVSEISSDSDSDREHEYRVLVCWEKRKSERRSSRRLQHGTTINAVGERNSLDLFAQGSMALDALEWREKSFLEKFMFFLTFKVPPSARFNIFWEMCGVLMLLYDVFTVPLELFMLPDYLLANVMSWVVCIFWTAHILKTFRTGYISAEGAVEMNQMRIAKRYAQTWLGLDVGCALVDWVALIKAITSQSDSTDMLSRVLRCVRLARLFFASELEGFITEQFHSEAAGVFASVAKIIVLLLAVTHVIACIWYFIGYHSDGGIDDGQLGWVRKMRMQRESFWEKYVCSLQWALAQFVGESILELHTTSERLFNIFIILFAFVFSSLFVSSITTLMTRVQITSMKQASQYRALRRYLMDNNISKSLSVRVQRNACHAVKRHMQSEADIELLKVISEPLRVELHFEAYSPIFFGHPFIENYSTLDPSGVRKVCHIGTSAVSISRGDVVFSNMETPVWPRMFFLVTGRMNYFQEGHDDCRLRRGHWACEPVLWTRWMHCGTLVAATDCNLLHLDASKFSMIVSSWPGDHAKNYAEAFVMALNMASRDDLTDLKTWGVQQAASDAFPDYQLDDDCTDFRMIDSIRSARSSTSPGGSAHVASIASYAGNIKDVLSRVAKRMSAKQTSVDNGG